MGKVTHLDSANRFVGSTPRNKMIAGKVQPSLARPGGSPVHSFPALKGRAKLITPLRGDLRSREWTDPDAREYPKDVLARAPMANKTRKNAKPLVISRP